MILIYSISSFCPCLIFIEIKCLLICSLYKCKSCIYFRVCSNGKLSHISYISIVRISSDSNIISSCSKSS
nr:MAG TPA: hypothetical protein [Caudoviricetes sp.]